ncbi:hypothetical protein B0H17DRAFT_1195590 [Mycena rosella]|uniref:DUF7730 domain-containing protein n=1 Tax=Mycena rosella TaxID=1033263 RepID=A0AAD7DWQ9_MYCRO|nr:hypothetical protein B0H17DRAFT_1195590 [Mycena rosella]
MRLAPGKKRGPPIPPLYPLPLPANHIDISHRPQVSQPTSCYLLRLPVELRHYIYEFALGGRIIALRVAASASHRHCVVRSRCYEPVDDADGSPNRLTSPTDRIPTALLVSCRQVYLEAPPILHKRNTYDFWVHEIEVVVAAALGQYYLEDIRSVYLRHNYATLPVPPWPTVFPLLQQMRLHRLTFEFDFQRLEFTELAPHKPVLDSAWGRLALGIRNLRRLELFFKNGDPPEYPVYRTNVARRFRQLMIGAEADERYEAFLGTGKERTDNGRMRSRASTLIELQLRS